MKANFKATTRTASGLSGLRRAICGSKTNPLHPNGLCGACYPNPALIALTDKDFGKVYFELSQVHNIQLGIPDRLGVGIMVEGLPGHESGLLVVPVDNAEIGAFFQAFADKCK